MKNIMSNKFNRNLSRMKALALSALVMLGVVSFTSCGEDGPMPKPPVVTVDSVSIAVNNVAELSQKIREANIVLGRSEKICTGVSR